MDSLTMQATYSNCQASLSKFPGAAPTKSPSVSPNRITGGAWVCIPPTVDSTGRLGAQMTQ